MDLSLLPKDDATQSFPAPADSRTGDSELSLLDSPNKNTLCAHKTETNILTNPSLSESLSVSRLLPQDDSTDSDHLKPSSTSYNMSECFSALKESDFRVCGCFGSSLPRLPHLPQDVISPRSECYSETYARATSTSQSSGAMSFVSEGLMKSSITELTFNHSSSPEQSPSTLLTWPLLPQPESVERDAVIAPVSDLYIFESDTLEADFILKPSVAPQEITCPGYQPFPQTGEKEADGHSSKNVLMCDSADVVTQYLHNPAKERTMADDESGMIHNSGHGPPAVDVDAYDVGLMLGSHVRQGKAEVTGLTPQLRRSDSTTEVWQDACQYLAEEDIKDQDVLDKRGHSVMRGGLSATCDLSFLPGNTQVSIYDPEVSDWIGCSSEKTRRPPVERWSSVDSWASALSDWTELITAVPEDITAAFTEIGAEIEALTQALAEVDTPAGPETAVKAQSQTLDVQAQPLEAHVPGSSVLFELSSLSSRFQAPPAERQGRESSQRESLSESTLTAPEEIQSQAESYQCPTHQHSAMGSADAMVASSQRDAVAVAPTLSPGSKSSGNLDISQFEGCVESITNAADPVILIIKEDTDLEEENAQTPTGEPLRDGRGEVTHGHRVSQGFGAEQEIQRSRGPVVVNAGGRESSLDLLFLTTDSLSLSSVDRQPSLHIDVSADTLPSLDGARQVEPQSGCPKFITPLAPLSIGSSLICQATGGLEGDQPCPKRFLNDNKDLSCDHAQPCVLWPTSDGITNKASSEGDEELIHKKENTAESEGQCKHSVDDSLSFLTEKKIVIEDIHELSRELSNLAPVPADHFIISQEKRVAFITLELNDPFLFWAPKPRKTDLKFEVDQEKTEEMPHKTRSKKDKAGGHHHGAQVSKKPEAPHVSAQHSCNKQDAQPPIADNDTREKAPARLEDRETKLGIKPDVAAETTPSKPHAKKKKKQAQNAAAGRAAPLAEVESGVKPNSPKGRIEMFEAKLGATAGKAAKDSNQSDLSGMKSQQPEDKALQGQHPPDCTDQPKSRTSSLMDDVVKRRRLAGDKFGKIVSVLESKVQKTDVSIKAKGDEPKLEAGATRKKAYSEVVKQKIPPEEEPKVVQPIQAAAVSGDPQSLSLWCQFACVFSDYAVTWSRDGRALAEIRRSAGDESRVSLTVSNASHKDLGKYQCRLSSSHGSVALDYLLTYEVLSEIVIPSSPKTISSVLVQVGSEEEDARCSSLMFKDDFLSDQYFGENHPVSIVTEKAHFGEGMHRRAFRTKLQAGQIPLLVPGHPCVLKVHNSISYGTKNNDELVQKNFSLAVEECQVQNTAREYIKAYTAVAQSTEAFGDVPEIIPIYLIHRPANDVPYATLEEELIGDFVKYSVKDGKEINLLRRDSEAGQKCCAFQHWVYEKTEGNLLVTDMQGVGMRLTDVGIATCKKGYKGFKGNCATSFIDQFKALHQCNRYCEILDLKSLQPKAKKPSAPKPKAQASAALKKKTTGPTVRGKT